jgi:dTDP-4-dehydrorhamnose reductase
MRIAILGATGLIGHKLLQKLAARFPEVHGLIRRAKSQLAFLDRFPSETIIDGVDVRNFDRLSQTLQAIDMDVILNCVGITKRRPEIQDRAAAIEVNSLFPHRLANWAGEHGKRVIHFSTDCVFDGKAGNYNEDSPISARDVYGRTKALGELHYVHTLTLRSSFVGRELTNFSELLEWFLRQPGPQIHGFRQAWYSGISSLELAKIVGDIIEFHPELNGLYQLSMPQPINKYDLLCIAREAFGHNLEIAPDDSLVTHRTLDGSRLREKIRIEIPEWPEMMAALAQEKGYGAVPVPRLAR